MIALAGLAGAFCLFKKEKSRLTGFYKEKILTNVIG
jgi:hypothetical protein